MKIDLLIYDLFISSSLVWLNPHLAHLDKFRLKWDIPTLEIVNYETFHSNSVQILIFLAFVLIKNNISKLISRRVIEIINFLFWRRKWLYALTFIFFMTQLVHLYFELIKTKKIKIVSPHSLSLSALNISFRIKLSFSTEGNCTVLSDSLFSFVCYLFYCFIPYRLV